MIFKMRILSKFSSFKILMYWSNSMITAKIKIYKGSNFISIFKKILIKQYIRIITNTSPR